MAKILWCMHARGPDELTPAKNYKEAVAMCDEIIYGAKLELVRPAPMIWPYPAEAHRSYLKHQCAAPTAGKPGKEPR